MEPFIALAVLTAMVKNFVDLVRRATSGDLKGTGTMLLAYFFGAVVVVGFAHSDFASGLVFGDVSLAGSNLVSQILIGVALASAAGLAKDTLKAVDNKQTEAVPELFSGQE